MLRLLLRSTVASSLLLSLPALAESDDGSTPSRVDDVPTVMVARVPAVSDATDITDQRTDGDVDVYALQIKFKRLEDGKLDLEDIRGQILDQIQTTDPVTVKVKDPDTTINEVPADLQKKFKEAEADSVAAYGSDEAYVAWRGYGPVRGYSRGVYAFGSTRYRGYYPYRLESTAYYGVNPYFGYYAYGRSYPFTYGLHRATPSYHYFLYHRYY